MKIKTRFLAAFALVVIIGFTMTACIEGGNGDPALTGTVSIIGDAEVGETLTADIDLLDGDGEPSFQWKRGSTNVGTNQDTYVIQPADEGFTISVVVTREGYSGSKTGGPTAVVIDPRPELTGDVYIIGDAIVGETLTADISELDGEGDPSYEWKRGSTVVGTESTYVIHADDVGSTITVTVTFSGNSGSAESDPTNEVIETALTGTVSISGTVAIGETLTANTGLLNGIGEISYLWEAWGFWELGTDSTYTIQPSDIGSEITVTVTRAGYSGSKTSNPTIAVPAPPITGFTFTPLDNLIIGWTATPGYNSANAFMTIGNLSDHIGGWPGVTPAYSLVSGVGDTDNDLFAVGTSFSNSFLRVGSNDLTEPRTYSVRVQVTVMGDSFAKQINFTVSYPPAGTPSAVIYQNGTISGRIENSEGIGAVGVNSELPQIYLDKATLVSSITEGTDVSSWFSPVIQGLSYRIKENYISSIALEVTGTPAIISSAAVTITIPGNLLLDQNSNPSITQGLVVSGEGKISYDITRAPEYVCRIGDTHYESIGQAIAFTTGLQTIIVTKSHEISSTITIASGRDITIRAETDGITISRAEGFVGNMFRATGGRLTFGNGSGGSAGSHNPRLIVDGSGIGVIINIGAGPNVNLYNGIELRNADTGVFIMGDAIQSGHFGMIGGVIAGCSNTGVNALQYANFTMNGGIVYGNAEGPNSNTVSINRGMTGTSVNYLGTLLPAGQQTETFGTAP